MIKVDFHDTDGQWRLKYVVLVAFFEGKLVVVRHKERTTWEIPGGHIEPGEGADEAASRELTEETGAVDFDLSALCDYSVSRDGNKPRYGRLYHCDIKKLGPLGDTEIGAVRLVEKLPESLTYEEIQPQLLEKVMNSLEQC